MSGFAVGLSGDRELLATHVPGRKKPYLGIKSGNTFLALAEFLSDEDMQALRDALEGVMVMPMGSK